MTAARLLTDAERARVEAATETLWKTITRTYFDDDVAEAETAQARAALDSLGELLPWAAVAFAHAAADAMPTPDLLEAYVGFLVGAYAETSTFGAHQAAQAGQLARFLYRSSLWRTASQRSLVAHAEQYDRDVIYAAIGCLGYPTFVGKAARAVVAGEDEP